ncbi:fatty acid amide hydrolase 2 [Trypanosoma conorhini]|uniref:Fatty acid amide hydrolase 2 n=1 Tax=Trypanosoma conorhini TaxID=83891 RepID=A0A3R7SB86_9TRYP|nr:fatty acid amide hydrolase 2 [Trypanosoma conorhini]RNF27471.1 fatty acid amide hydrolase 2 [Trypanosoma conorhini]
MMRLSLIFALVLLSLVWWFCGSLAGTALLVGYAYLANKAFGLYLMAGPRTSRQVPDVPIAYCQQLSAVQLSNAYSAGELSCEDVVRTYIEHIKRVNPYLNLMVFECFDDAIEAAVKADAVWSAWRANRSRPAPSWLLGVPCTIKECMAVVGCPNTSGHPHRRHIIAKRDSPVVKNFRDAGAIILGVTNTSELCMWYESSNHVYGISCNPYDTRCLVGGSSGGEGAAAGAVFSTFSLGSDIGGSIRMPAFFNGVFGQKSSPHYISNRGQHPSPKTAANHYMATGPICRFAEDIAPLCHVAARGGFLEDPKIYPPRPPLGEIPEIEKGKPLRVFALEDFGITGVRTSWSQLAAVRLAAQCLEQQYGAKVVYVNLRDRSRCTGGEIPVEFRPFADVFAMWISALSSDPTENRFTALMGEGNLSFNALWELLLWFVGRSQHTLPALALCVIEFLDQSFPSKMRLSSPRSDIAAFKRALESLLRDDGVILAPTFPRPAPRHHLPLMAPLEFQYTAAFNVLQMPATAVPIWTPDLQGSRTSVTPADVRERRLPPDYHLPKGVQIVSRELNDELGIGVAIALEKALGGYKYPGWAVLEEHARGRHGGTPRRVK